MEKPEISRKEQKKLDRKHRKEKQKNSPKYLLKTAIRRIGYAFLGFLTAPLLMHSSFKNQGHPLYIPVFILGLLIGICAFIYGVLGIRNMMRFVFLDADKKKEAL